MVFVLTLELAPKAMKSRPYKNLNAQIESLELELEKLNAATSLPVNNRDAWVLRIPVFRREFVSLRQYCRDLVDSSAPA